MYWFPLSPTAAGDVSGATRAWRAIEADSGTSAMPEGVEDTLDIAGGTAINTEVLDSSGPTATVTINHDNINVTPTTGATATAATEYISNITVNSQGHVTAYTTSVPVEPVADAPLDFSISGLSSYASGASQSYQLTLNHPGFDVTNEAWIVQPGSASDVSIGISDGLLSDSNTSVRTGTVTVQVSFNYQQTDKPTRTGSMTLTHTIRIFAPYYSGIRTSVPTAFVPNADLTRATTELVSGGNISFNAGSETQEAIINLRDADFPVRVEDAQGDYVSGVQFRTGGFLIIEPHDHFSDGTSGYTTYVISLTPNTRINIEVI